MLSGALQRGYVAGRFMHCPLRMDPLYTRHMLDGTQRPRLLVGQDVASEDDDMVVGPNLHRMRMTEPAAELGPNAIGQYGVVHPPPRDPVAGARRHPTAPIGEPT